jgi:hypothetical protein
MNEVSTTSVPPPPALDAMEEEDPYYAKLGEFYSEWVTLKEENEKVKEEEDNRPFRYEHPNSQSYVFQVLLGLLVLDTIVSIIQRLGSVLYKIKPFLFSAFPVYLRINLY